MAHCLNCKSELLVNSKFCSLCGQKAVANKLSLFVLIQDFFTNFFNLESKIWRTLRDIWIPGKLTQMYVSGRRASYYNPLRILLVSLVTFVTLLLFSLNDILTQMNKLPLEMNKSIWEDEKIVEFDSLVALSNLPEEGLISLRKKLFDENMPIADSLIKTALNESGQAAFTQIREDHPELNLFDRLQILDSLAQLTDFSPGDSTETLDNKYTYHFDSDDDFEITDGLPADDFFKLSEDELKAKYGNGVAWKEKGIIQLQKVVQQPLSSIKFLIGNGIWALLLVIFLLGFVFKLLYIRQRRMYVEHTIFHLYGHTRILLMAIIGLSYSMIFDADFWWLFIVFIAGIIYLFWGMRVYYGQSIFKTFIKYSLTLFAYINLLSFCTVIIIGISFLVFN